MALDALLVRQGGIVGQVNDAQQAEGSPAGLYGDHPTDQEDEVLPSHTNIHTETKAENTHTQTWTLSFMQSLSSMSDIL